ncbi:T9SS type A sorting domain-containing protein [Fulvivirga maritima]|uniref:T9SS type A sorting domain-containing protein n=1 Tax=Fulvivirga maritima TaxID=2904247 RepID=UPI001F44F936|nr:T9SS type A sorting domain-containing protein [Fulvivirga maritima]UII24549.1 T9SS type A sorting domain-containing protein [Fulvivirga maritima]
MKNINLTYVLGCLLALTQISYASKAQVIDEKHTTSSSRFTESSNLPNEYLSFRMGGDLYITDGTKSGTVEIYVTEEHESPHTFLANNGKDVYFRRDHELDLYYVTEGAAPQKMQDSSDEGWIYFYYTYKGMPIGIADYGYYTFDKMDLEFVPFAAGGWRDGITRGFEHPTGVYIYGEAFGENHSGGDLIYRITDSGNEIVNYLERSKFFYNNHAEFVDFKGNVIAFTPIDEGEPNFHTDLYRINRDNSLDMLVSLPQNGMVTSAISSDNFIYLSLEIVDENADVLENSLWRTDGTAAGTQYLEDLGGRVDFYRGVGMSEICRYEPDYFACSPLLSSNIFESEDGKYYFWAENGGLSLYTPQGFYANFTTTYDYIRILGMLGDDLVVLKDGEVHKYDMGTNCGARAVIAFNQGKKKSGAPVPSGRSNPQMSLGDPQENDEINFVALGFGGSITLALGTTVYDEGTAEPDLILVETSFGRADQFCYSEGVSNYPEQAFVEVSEDGVNWYSLPNVYCRTSFIDIKPAVEQGMAYASFIRITDVSNPLVFQNSADGFDLDGVITCREEVEAAKGLLTNSRIATSSLFNSQFINKAPDEVEEGFTLYPNPVTNGELTLQFKVSQAQVAHIRVIDITGKEKLQKTVSLSAGTNAVKLEVSTLSKGTYIVELSAGDRVENTKIIIQ